MPPLCSLILPGVMKMLISTSSPGSGSVRADQHWVHASQSDSLLL